jgi:hypothetical protein
MPMGIVRSQMPMGIVNVRSQNPSHP